MTTVEDANNALSKILDSGSKKNLIDLAWIKNVRVILPRAIITLSLPSFANSQRERIVQEVKNILLKLQGKPLVAWEPQDQFLGIIGTGDGNAIASKGPLAVEGEYIWELKDSIDRKWMAMYTTDLPELATKMIESEYIDNSSNNISGNFRRKLGGASVSEITRLPKFVYVPSTKHTGTSKSCTVCMEDYKEGDSLRTLPCLHQFHANCIDEWLGYKSSCPVCKASITDC